MGEPATTNHRVRFGVFELNLRTRELCRDGTRLKVQGQPIDVLEALLERPGELVTREELRKRLWPQDTFVDFEHSLNSTIARLRDALNDRAEDPRFIQTLPRLGYRFIANTIDGAHVSAEHNPAIQIAEVIPISAELGINDSSAPALSPTTVRTRTGRSRLPLVTALSFGILSLGFFAVRYLGPPLPPPRIADVHRLTHDSNWTQKRVMGIDGSRLLLSLEPIGLGQVQREGGDITAIPLAIPDFSPSDVRWIGSVSPDGNFVLAYGAYHDDKDPKREGFDVWIAATTGTSVRYLTRAGFFGAGWSPDGKEVIYSTTDKRVYTIPSAGGEPRFIRALDASSIYFTYSPDGKKIRFTYCVDNSDGRRIWEMSKDGSNLHEVLPRFQPGRRMYGQGWTPDGNFFLFLLQELPSRGNLYTPTFQIWALDERAGLLRRASAEPTQFAAGPTAWMEVVPSRDSSTLYSQGKIFQGELIRFNRKTKLFEPYLNGKSIEMLSFSRDGKHMVYSSYPDGILWRANTDGSAGQQLGRAPYYYPQVPKISPDGSQIAFIDIEFAPWRSEIFLMPSIGGTPIRLLPNDPGPEYDPTWSPDGNRLAFLALPAGARSEPRIQILDLATHEISTLPHAPMSEWSPRWSPDGKYLLCTSRKDDGNYGLQIYSFETKGWKLLPTGSLTTEWPSWSSDSLSIYWAGGDRRGIGLYRIALDGRAPERLAYLPRFHPTGVSGAWFGLDSNDNPIFLRDAGTTEVYALTLDVK